MGSPPPSFSKAELDALQKADLRLGSLSPHQQAAVDFMRARLAQLPAEMQPCQQIQEDVRLLRFLRSRQWKCEEAWGVYEAFLTYRKQNGLDSLVGKMLEANADFFAGRGDVLREIHFHPLSKAFEEPYPRMFTQNVVGGYRLLFDRHGNLLVLEKPGSADYPGLVALGVDGAPARRHTPQMPARTRVFCATNVGQGARLERGRFAEGGAG